MKRTAITTLALILLLLPATLYAQVDSLALREFGDLRLDNCGVNAAVFLLHWFDLSVDLPRLQDELEVGSHWEQATSMLLLKKSLEANGLSVSAYKNATLDETLVGLDETHVCLLHVNRGGDLKKGHFYLVPAVANGSVLLVDPARDYEWVTVDEYKRQFAEMYSGYYLSVSRSTKPSPREYTLAEKVIEVDVGVATNDPGTLIVTIPVINTKQVPIIIESAKGSCSCFETAAFRGDHPTRLEPGEKQSLELKFNRSSLGLGGVQRYVSLHLRDTEARDLEIKVSVRVVERPVEQRVVWFPQKIDYGLVKDADIFQKPQELTVSLPPGVILGDIIPSSSNVVVKAVGEEKNADESNQVMRRVYRFEVAINAVQPGPLKEKLLISTTDTNYPILEIPLVGELMQR